MNELNIKWPGKIEKGKIILESPVDFKRHILSFEGRMIQVIVQKHKTNRTLRQNAYYFGCIIPIIADFVGEDDKESIHQSLKEKFLEVRNSKGLKIVQSTRKLTTTEFTMYIERVRRWAVTECELIIPDPEKVDF